MMKWRIVLVYVALMLFTLLMTNQPAVASKPSEAEGGIFVRIPTVYASEVSQLDLATTQWLDYGSFQWLEISSAELSRLQASNIPVTVDTEAGVVQITRYRFDPIAQGEPDVPAELQASGNGRGFHLVQFAGPIQTSWLEELTAAGLPTLQYYPHNTYLTWGAPAQLNALEGNSAVRWHGAVHPAYKLSETLDGREGLIRNVNLVIYNDGQLEETLKQVEDLGGQLLQTFPSQPDRAFYDAILVMDAAVLPQVAQIANVLWVGYIGDAPRLDDEMSSQIIAGNYNGAGVPFTGYNAHLANLGYDGTGVVWAIVDSGVDYDHPDLGSRIVGGHNFAGCATANPGDASDDGHGTHVAGIVGGNASLGFADGNGFLYGLGVAPAYSIFAMNPICNNAAAWPPAGGWQENSKQAVLGNAVGSNNSWTTGEGTQHGYQASERTHDFMVRDGNFDTAAVAEPVMTVFSAGNSGNSGLTAPKEAKNIIVTASSENFRTGSINTISSFSSRGPAVDGRVGITIAAPGGQIASTMSDTGGSCTTPIGGTSNRYSFCSGTSMASPHASGALALITEWWRDSHAGANPSPAMARALLVNGAVDMGTADIPNINEGWGRINITQVISPSADVRYYDQTHLFTETGQQWSLVVGTMDPTKPAKITLTWSDAPGAVGANPALVNNLDLQVTNNSNTYRGNVFTGGWSATGGTADTRHNTENVYIQNPVGDMTIVVAATNIAGDGVPYNGDTADQDFALVCYNCALEPDFSLLATPASYATCTLTTPSVDYNLTVGSIMSFTDNVALSALGNPAGTSTNFTVNPVTPPGSSVLTIGNLGSAAAGSYNIAIVGTAPTSTHTTTVGLNLYTAAPGTVALNSPANGATGVGLSPTLTWTAVANATDYDVEVATDMAFTNIVFTDTVAATSANLSGLSANTTYYWRVTPNNVCGAGTTSSIFNFTTASLYCRTPNLPIPDSPSTGVTDTFVIADTGEITDLDISILAAHTWVGDLQFTLVHQDTGTSVMVIDRPGVPASTNGCSGNDIDATLDDEAGVPVETQCAGSVPTIAGTFTPNNALSAFDGQDLSGTWLLTVRDNAGADVGTLNEWCLLPTLTNTDPEIAVTPTELGATVTAEGTADQTLTIWNMGDSNLDWDIVEDAGRGPVGNVFSAIVRGNGRANASTAAELVGTIAETSAVAQNAGKVEIFAPTAVIYDNGPLVNLPAGGSGGADASVLQTVSLGMSTIGFGHQIVNNNSVADDFVIPADQNWVIDTVTFFTYQTNSPITSTITGYNYDLYDGPPNAGGVVIFSGNTLLSSTWSGAYRVTETTVTNSTRPIMASTVDFGGLALGAGTYWLEWQAAGSLASGPWAPAVTVTGQAITGNALQNIAGVWNNALDGGTGTPHQGFPFIIEGTSTTLPCSTDVPWLSVNPISGTIAAGGSEDVIVTYDATGYAPDVYTGTLCINSNDPVNPQITVPVTMTVSAAGVDVGPNAALSAVPAETITYSVAITNTGINTDTFDLTLAGGTWTTQLSVTDITLMAGETGSFDVTVEVPAGAWAGDWDAVTVMATSQADNAISDWAELTTTAEAVYGFDWSADTTAHTGAAGETVTYTISLTNTGNTTDTFNISLVGHSWATTASASSLMLAPDESADFTVSVVIDGDAVHPDSDTVTVTAASAGDGSVTDDVALTTSVEVVSVYGFGWSADTTAHEGTAGETVTYTISLTNTGNTIDTFNISLAGHSWATTSSHANLTLAPGASADFTVSVTIAGSAVHPDTDTVTVTATSQGDNSVTESVNLTTSVEEIIVPASPVIYLPMIMKP